jgi:hypothetical protein
MPGQKAVQAPYLFLKLRHDLLDDHFEDRHAEVEVSLGHLGGAEEDLVELRAGS